MNLTQHGLVTADGRQANLYFFKRTPGGELHIDHVRSLVNPHEREHERHRPSLLGGSERRGGMGHSSASAAPHSVSQGHGEEEEQRRFVLEVKSWLRQAEKELALHRLTLFAAPRFLGLLREHMGDRASISDLLEGELTKLTPQELSHHPAVRRALDWKEPARGKKGSREANQESSEADPGVDPCKGGLHKWRGTIRVSPMPTGHSDG
jgi:protein required for attachment to host cells